MKKDIYTSRFTKKDRRVLIENTKKGYQEFLLEADGGSAAIEKAKKDPDVPIYLVGIIQKGDTPNRNGRVYPFSILKKECDRYMNEEIKDGQSFSELDHPCFDKEHFIMTNNGWKSIVDIQVGEIVATLNPKTEELEYKSVLKKIDLPYEGEMYKMKNQLFSAVCTPNHKWPVKDNIDGEIHLEESRAIENKNKFITQKVQWNGEKQKEITISGLDTKLMKQDIKIETTLFMKFLGLYLAKGWCALDKRGYGTIAISQVKQEGKRIIKEVLEKLPFVFVEQQNKKNKDEITFVICDTRLTNYLLRFGSGAKNKIIIPEIKQLDKEYLEVLLEYLYIGDGCGSDYYTKSKQLADDVCELLIKCGFGASMSESICHDTFYEVKNLVTEEVEKIHNIKFYTENKYKDHKSTYEILEKERIYNESILYVVRKKTSSHYSVKNIKFEKFWFDDRIYCIEVENHTFLTKHNGKISWTGNCDSTVPELKNAAATIEDIWYKGVEVWGRIKLLNAFMPEVAPGKMARGIVLNGKTLGISSRALGSVYQDGSGYDVVEDDLEIICWDLVSRPSTYDANLKLTESQRKTGKNLILTESQYLGSKNLNESRQMLKEKRLQSLTEEEKVYLDILGIEKFLQIKYSK